VCIFVPIKKGKKEKSGIREKEGNRDSYLERL
jgi:hypothetical protein